MPAHDSHYAGPRIRFAGAIAGVENDPDLTGRTLRFVELMVPLVEAVGEKVGPDAMLAGLLTITVNLGLNLSNREITAAALQNAIDQLPNITAAIAIAEAEDSQPAGRA